MPNFAHSARTPAADDEGSMSMRIIYLVAALILFFLLWASLTELEEVTRGEGRVTPAQKIQILQTAEPGVMSQLFVRAGQRVAKDEIIVRLDKTPNSAHLGEVEAKVRSLRAQLARLEMENEARIDQQYACPTEIIETAPAVCRGEMNLFDARINSLKSRISVHGEKAEQKRRDLSEAASNVARFTETLALAKRELEMVQPLASEKIISDLDLIRAQRAVAEADGQLRASKEAKARAEAGVRESILQVDEQKITFRQTAMAEMTEKRAELSVALETTKGAVERLRRTDLVSPVDGIVNEIYVNTQGAFLNPGDKVLSIVPVEDTLLVETRVRPSDIAFIHPGQPALIKITAFDYSIYGGLEGTVGTVSADTMFDPNTKEAYYTVVIRTKETTLKNTRGENQIIPGMICNAEIMTGRKSVMQYLLKPINRARENALRER